MVAWATVTRVCSAVNVVPSPHLPFASTTTFLLGPMDPLKTVHSFTGTKVFRSPEPMVAPAMVIPPAPKVTATAAPIAAQRARMSEGFMRER